jgi:hypothetical protein
MTRRERLEKKLSVPSHSARATAFQLRRHQVMQVTIEQIRNIIPAAIARIPTTSRPLPSSRPLPVPPPSCTSSLPSLSSLDKPPFQSPIRNAELLQLVRDAYSHLIALGMRALSRQPVESPWIERSRWQRCGKAELLWTGPAFFEGRAVAALDLEGSDELPSAANDPVRRDSPAIASLFQAENYRFSHADIVTSPVKLRAFGLVTLCHEVSERTAGLHGRTL